MSKREHSDITHVKKRGNIYTISGVSHGNHASFHVDAKTIESMSTRDAKDFMKRSIHNIAQHSNE